eukprot:c28333_g1_i1 orf=286-2127(+)
MWATGILGASETDLQLGCSTHRVCWRMAHKNPKCDDDCIPETALEFIFGYIDDSKDRHAISLVCKRWQHLESLTRKGVTITFSYSAKPTSLRRFKRLESFKLKGKPRAAKFHNLVPEDWGGYAESWVKEIAVNCQCVKSISFRRTIVTDEDLIKLAKERGHMLQELKLNKCSGFSTTGLEAITRSCRSLRALSLDDSNITDQGGKWLHQLALHNTSLEVLNFFASDLAIEIADLETLMTNCKSLRSLKVNEVDLTKLSGVLREATALQELGGVVIQPSIDDNGQQTETVYLPRSLTSLIGLCYMGGDEGDESFNSTILPLAPGLKKLDLQRAFLGIEGHCELLCHCSKLEVLEVLFGIGDQGLEVVANTCHNLRRLRVEFGDRELQEGFITQRGLIAIAQSCSSLEYIAAYISNINNAALMAFGEGCPKLTDFRLVLLDEDNFVPDFPLDEGVMSLLQGCPELNRFALYLRPGSLSDIGMGYIGKFGHKLKWLLLGRVGDSDMGLSMFADGCPSLEKLEMRDCVFSEAGIAMSMLKMKSLKYVWVQGYKATEMGRDLLSMKRFSWNIELIHCTVNGLGEDPGLEIIEKEPAQFLAYRSVAGLRTDNPETVICL